MSFLLLIKALESFLNLLSLQCFEFLISGRSTFLDLNQYSFHEFLELLVGGFFVG